MKKIALIALLSISISIGMAQQKNRILHIEEKVHLKIPKDLLEVWNDLKFKSANKEFYLRNFNDLIFLVPEDLTDATLAREVGGAMDESNKLYFLKKEGKITNEEGKALSNAYYRDIVMMSKNYRDGLNLVFATSPWREGFVDIYYRFNSQREPVGIYLSDNDQGSLVPIYLGKNLSDVFGDISRLKKGFEEKSKLTDFINKYGSNEELKSDEFPYGVFPNQDMRIMIRETIDDMLELDNKNIEELSDSIKTKIQAIYKIQGKELIFNEENTSGFSGLSDISSFLKDKNNQPFNDGKEKRIFIVEFPYSNTIGIALCSPAEARKLNDLGVFRFDWLERTEKEFKFMNYDE